MSSSPRRPPLVARVAEVLSRWLEAPQRQLRTLQHRGDARYTHSKIALDVVLGRTQLEGRNTVGFGCVLRGEVSLGFATTLGRRCVLHGGRISLGRYTQLGPEVAIYALNHSLDHLTTYVNRALLGGQMQERMSSELVEVGSDVWIGHGAIVIGSLKIGDGAVIGAGAVVVKDVPPYSLAVGNPARIVRRRFPDDIIELLLRLRWWDWPEERLARHAALFGTDSRQNPDEFRRRLMAALESAEAVSVSGARSISTVA